MPEASQDRIPTRSQNGAEDGQHVEDQPDRPESPNPPSDSSSHTVHSSLERIPTAQDGRPDDQTNMVRTATTASAAGPVHSVFTTNQKRFIIFMASWAGFFSPVSGMIYFPALNSLASSLHVSNTLINLTLTSYMIFQGLAPAFIGDLADSMGRRVAYAVCFLIYIGANVGLALQNSYPALFVLRCLQSSGSSGTIAMASGIVSDVATASERGAYMGFVTSGALLGPAIGPALGGVLAEFLGWRAIFWFLLIMGVTFFAVFAIFFPETARSQVGNGSIPPKGWNMSLMNYLAVRKAQSEGKDDLNQADVESTLPPKPKVRFPNPFSTIHVLFDLENALLLFYNGFLFASFYSVTAAIPSQFAEMYHFNDLQIGLCYIPFGVGSMCAALSNGQLLDRNFARWCRKLNVKIKKGRTQDLRDFPIEKVRLQLAIPAAYLNAVLVMLFGWVMQINGPLAAMLVILFFSAFSLSVASNVTSTLLVDFYPGAPATATATNNLVRCLLGAGATAALVPLINAIGRGWTFTFLGLLLIATSPMLWAIYFKGMGWREQRRVKEELARERKDERRAGSTEEAKDSEKLPVQGGLTESVAVAENQKGAP